MVHGRHPQAVDGPDVDDARRVLPTRRRLEQRQRTLRQSEDRLAKGGRRGIMSVRYIIREGAGD
jgi:hypothetical protein